MNVGVVMRDGHGPQLYFTAGGGQQRRGIGLRQ